MNWRRGLFRAWLLLTIIWCIVIGAFVADPIINPQTAPLSYAYAMEGEAGPFEARSDAPRLIEFSEWMKLRGDEAVSTLDADGEEDGVTIFLPRELSNDEARRRIGLVIERIEADQTNALAESRWETARGALLLMAIVPAIFFALGASILWVLLGFKGARG